MKAMVYALFVAVLALSCFAAHAQGHPSLSQWVTAGWKLVSETSGDLNRDGIPDKVLVLQGTDPGKIKPNEGGLGAKVLDTNPRRLLVLFGTRHGFDQILLRDDLLSPEHEEDSPCSVDPLSDGGGIRIEKAILSISLHYWSSCGSYGAGGTEFKFRYSQQAKFHLIGVEDGSSSRSTGQAVYRSINLLTGRQKITEYNHFDDSKEKVRWTYAFKGPWFLEDVKLDCGLGPETGNRPWCETPPPSF